MRNNIEWSLVESGLPSLSNVEGGFSNATRGIVVLDSGKRVFVKVGTDEDTKKWANAELIAYDFLSNNNYSHAPEVLSRNVDNDGFAIDALVAEDGWDWTNNWTEERLSKTLFAMDELADIEIKGTLQDYFMGKSLTQKENGWNELAESSELLGTLKEKAAQMGSSGVLEEIDFEVARKRSNEYVFSTDNLVHNDVRADNCAWNASTQQVRLVDWNWASLGDRGIDVNAFLVSVSMSGFDVNSCCSERLNADALGWLAGFWFAAAAKPIWEDGPEHLRDFQFESALEALKLIERIKVA